MDLLDELQNLVSLLDQSVKSLRKTNEARAKTEMDYKILLREETLKLRDTGMAIGLIDKTCYGIPSVALARFQRDIADGNYEANKEAINVYKLRIRLLENQINREYGMEGKQL